MSGLTLGLMTGRCAGDRSALLCMLVSVVASSAAPLLVSVLGASHFPFLFTAGMQAGGLFGCLLFLLACHRSLLCDPRVRGALLGSVLRLDRRAIWFLLGTVSGLDYALFAWSSRHVDVAVTTVLFETWPLFLVFLMALLYRGVGRYRTPTPALVLLLLVGFGGCGLVVSSQHGGLDGFFGSAGVNHLALGAGLALLAALVTSLSAYLFRWASALSGVLAPYRVVSGGGVSLELFGMAVGMVVSDVFSISMNAVIGFAAGESLSFVPVMVGFLGGILIYSLGSLAWRAANLLTSNLGVNALGYAAPLLALGLLWVFSRADVARLDYLVVGAIVLIAVNLLLQLGPELRRWLG